MVALAARAESPCGSRGESGCGLLDDARGSSASTTSYSARSPWPTCKPNASVPTFLRLGVAFMEVGVGDGGFVDEAHNLAVEPEHR